MLIRSACILVGEEFSERDILIKAGKIARIGKRLHAAKEIDAKGSYVFPGLIDPHAHFRDLGQKAKEDFYTGSCAAAAGGVTTVFDMPNSSPPTTSLKALELKRRAARKSIISYGFHFGAALGNLDQAKASGLAVKVYFGHSTGNMGVSDPKYLRQLANAVPLILWHAEDQETIDKNTEALKRRTDHSVHSHIRSAEAEIVAIKKILNIIKGTPSKHYFCHVSTANALKLLKKANDPTKIKESDSMSKKEKINNKKAINENNSIKETTNIANEASNTPNPLKNKRYFIETAPHHLFLTAKDLELKKNYAKMNPSLRGQADVDGLWEGIKDGTIDVIGTDHAPHLRSEKEKPYHEAPSGVPGIENYLALLLNAYHKKKMPLKKIIELCCNNPAAIFGLRNKGFIKEGYDADLVIVDIDRERTIENSKQYTKCKWSPYHGMTLKGWPVMTICNGNVVFDEGGVHKNKGKEVSSMN